MIVTLTTDFGLRDPYVGMMKGVILTRAPGTSVVDLTHDIPAHRPLLAGFWLARSWDWFPAGTVHVAVVDPGVGSERRLLALEHRHCIALAPDNGLLEPLLAAGGAVRVLDLPGLSDVLPPKRSRSFHGRDVLAPLAAEIVAGRLAYSSLGSCVEDPVRVEWPAPVREPEDGIAGTVMLVDHFGNLISNIDAALVPETATRVVIGEHVIPLMRCYADAAPGQALALINAHDLLEIAVFCGRAADALGAGAGTTIRVSPASTR